MPDLLNTVKGFVNGEIGSLSQQNGQVSPYLRPTRLAHNIFDQNTASLTNNTPYLGFQYFTRIYPNGSVAEEYLKGYFSPDKTVASISPVIKSVSLPSMNVDTDSLNEYNRYRVNQSKINYDPVKITFHDATDGKVLSLWRAYYDYYFADGREKTGLAKAAPNPHSENFEDTQFGYNLANVKNEKYLFDKIAIYQVHGTTVNTIILHNPRISSFDHDVMSYESNDLVEMTMTFEYEYVEYAKRTDIITDGTTDDELRKFLGRGLSDPLEMAAFKNFSVDLLTVTPTTPSSATAGLGASIANAQSPLELIKSVKKEAQNVIGYAASASALFNQVQIDVLGVDTPIIEAPSVREFSAIVNKVPTSYSDVRRVVRNIKYGS